MIRGTTPTHRFAIPFDTSMLAEVLITYGQRGEEILTKDIDDCTLSGNEISITLTQEETLKFEADAPLQIQLRALTQSGDAVASRIAVIDVGDVLNDEVME